MIIGVPKEIKKEEYRVAMTPFGVEELKQGTDIQYLLRQAQVKTTGFLMTNIFRLALIF